MWFLLLFSSKSYSHVSQLPLPKTISDTSFLMGISSSPPIYICKLPPPPINSFFFFFIYHFSLSNTLNNLLIYYVFVVVVSIQQHHLLRTSSTSQMLEDTDLKGRDLCPFFSLIHLKHSNTVVK